MSTDTNARVLSIRRQLDRVEALRAAQAADPTLSPRLFSLKAFQQRRFRQSYQDVLANPRYELAGRFFLDELYGPGDFSTRDGQFAHVVPALVRLFPGSVVDAVELLVELHALTELLDDTMARARSQATVSLADYTVAWGSFEQLESRFRQLDLVLALGRRMDQLTKNRLLRQSLRWMRPAARAAGLEELQQFLERGFDGFAAIKGSDEFLAIIETRERQFIARVQTEADSERSTGNGNSTPC